MTPPFALDAVWMRDHPPPAPGDGGKDERGRVLIVGGGVQLVGAAMLAGVAALRAGAGKLQVAIVEPAVSALSIALPEARILALPRDDAGRPGGDAAAVLEPAMARCDALLIGPGAMNDDAGLARALLGQRSRGPAVIDAGALDAVKTASPMGVRILTPHAGEMARLLDQDKAKIEADPLRAGREAARRFQAVVVMKGARTHVVGPEGAAALYAGGGPGLGVSGSGDVLGGLIVGLLARGAAPFEAAAWGVYLHGEAGARLAAKIGKLGFLAREIADEVPAILSSF